MKYRLGFVLLMILLFSCFKLPTAVGKSRNVVILSSSIDTTLIINNLQIYNYFPQREHNFIFLFAHATVIKKFNKFHTLFLYGSLQDNSINVLLNEEAKEATKRDTFSLFKLNDLWAKNQLVIVLAISEPHYISQGIMKYSNIIRKILEDNYYLKVKENYYQEGINQKIKKTLERFGISFDLQKGWLIDSTYKMENFISVHAHFPDRSVFFYKEKKLLEPTDSFAIAKRNFLTKKYYDGDYIFKDLIHTEKIEFHNMKGIRLRGVWQNDSLVAGGPFLSYFLTDKDTLYIIDGVLFLPGERKTEFFSRIEVLMNSFRITHY